MGRQKGKLTDKQERFCREYLVDQNATQAAIRAGYSQKNADVTGSEVLGKTWVKDRVKALAAKQAERLDLKADDVLRELLLIAKVDIAKLYDKHGRLLPIHQIPEDVRRTIAGVDISLLGTTKVRFWDKPRALELLGRSLKLFVDRIEHGVTEDLAAVIREARERVRKGEADGR
jgi:phage terminase small subunit